MNGRPDCVSPNEGTGGRVMVWVVIAALAILLVGLIVEGEKRGHS